ncbi:hypothetical protein O6H91_17G027900 [Diphasiastrum complanatum]|uniref:Uncharacterized protein n=1 Tax=Diphasiastrum complanatum TaxID=34168 RepID=A0ACC2B570_DIPCM|nr:hypothetical protein O6H91_17G027900 [Diphasiastrum complanatum]
MAVWKRLTNAVTLRVGVTSRGSNCSSMLRDGYSDSSLREKSQEKQALLLLAMVAIFELALTLQILSFKNLAKESGFYSVILCTTSVGVSFTALIVIDVLRRVHADVPATVKLCFYVTLFYFCLAFFMNVTASNSHHFYVVPSIFVLIALFIVVHFTMSNIAMAKNSRVRL